MLCVCLLCVINFELRIITQNLTNRSTLNPIYSWTRPPRNKKSGSFVNKMIRLTCFVFWLQLSDLRFMSYEALNLAKNMGSPFFLLHFSPQSSDAAEKNYILFSMNSIKVWFFANILFFRGESVLFFEKKIFWGRTKFSKFFCPPNKKNGKIHIETIANI